MASLSYILRRPEESDGIWGWLTTVDHKRIGTLYMTTSIFFFLVGGAEAIAMRAQLASPNSTMISADLFNQLFTMHALTMIFLAIMPMGVAFFNWLIPLQIGARDVAFPRLNALSYWVYLFGAITLNLGWLTANSPNAGWFAYANLTSIQFSPTVGLDFYVLGLLVLGTSSLLGAMNFVVTVINLRAPGMTLIRMPIFTWMAFITSILLVLAIPVITIGLIELGFDRFFGTLFFDSAAGDVLLWQHLFWVFGHPEVYILILPAMGMVSEIFPTFARKPLFGFPVVVFSGIAIAFMGWSVWAHHMFATGMGPVPDSVFAATTMAIAIPTGVKVFNWLATIWGGNIRFTTSMMFALGFIALFTIGGLSGMTHAAAPSDLQQTDTYYIVAHIHYVLFGGSIMAIFAGIYYWYPKMFGRLLNEKLGKWNFWLVFIGMNMTFGPMHYVGLMGMPRRNYMYPSDMGWDFWNQISSGGSLIMAVGILIFLHNFFRSRRKGEIAGNDPWDARTLEWSISSPPPHYNFAEIPEVTGGDAFWETKYPGGKKREAPVVDIETNDIHIEMPRPSFYPLITAVGMALLALTMVTHPIVGVLGLLTLLWGSYGWMLEPAE